MKQKTIMIVIIMILLTIWFYPKKEEAIYLNQQGTPYHIFKVEVSCGIYHTTHEYMVETTVKDALEDALEVLPDCKIDNINLNRMIQNNEIITLDDEKSDIPEVSKVNINQASFQALLTVPGITETRAASIIIYREQHGDFSDLDELIHVKYIGVSTLEKIKPYLTLS